MKVKILILPKFEGSSSEGITTGEAGLFYNAYLKSSEAYRLINGKTVYYDEESRIALGLCGIGKVGAASYLTALLSDSRFDFSDAYILCVGCAGSASGYSTMGDVCVVSEIVNYDLGYETIDKASSEIKWFYDGIFGDTCHIVLNPVLISNVFESTKDIMLDTTDTTLRVMAGSFPGEEWALRRPRVITGTSMTSDTFWKGQAGHAKALRLNRFYGCADPFAITEMEDIACASVARQFGLLDRFIDLRVSVNIDIFKKGETPESIWGNPADYAERVTETNDETLDIFPVAMENLFRVAGRIIDMIQCGVI